MKAVKYILNIVIWAVVAVFVSCSREINLSTEVIIVNPDKAHPVELNKGRIIELETTDSSLLYDITRIAFLKNKFFIFSRNKIVVFDKDGNYLFDLSGLGQALHDYAGIASLFVKNEHIYLYDSMGKKVLCFNESGSFISSTNINPNNPYPLSDIYPLSDDRFIGKNMFRGDHVQTPVGSILDENYHTVDVVKGKNVNSGMTVYDNFFQYQEEILYWEVLCDTIFHISDSKIIPKYYVDFGQYAIPESERKNKDIYDLIDYTNNPENINKTAGFIRYINEDERYVKFMFIFQQKTHYTFYDKSTKIAHVYRFIDT
ncbi:MAG: 6-bladed beta-propeller, partial [Tannerella sp.]|nr:6-bladed beta-propeller [Tannerella sp.]